MFRASALTLTALSATLALTPLTFAADTPPVDATGNARVSQAPYVQPADHNGQVIGANFSLKCKVSCPAEAIDVMEVREGNETAAHKTPGLYHAGDVTLCGDKRTMKPILDWFEGIKTGTLTNFRQNLTLEILATNVVGKQAPVCTFTLYRAWPHQINWAEDGSVCIQIAVEDTELASP